LAEREAEARHEAKHDALSGLLQLNTGVTQADGAMRLNGTGKSGTLYTVDGTPATADPESRPLVIDLIGRYRDKVHPVGRLDFNSEGLLLLTNDGKLTNLITSASQKVPKVYEVKVKGKPDAGQIDRLRKGVRIDGVRTYPAEIRELPSSDANSWYAVTLYQGRNQQIRKMFDVVGHSVVKLRRVAIGILNDDGLKPGHYRLLDESEVKRLFKQKKERAGVQAPGTKKARKKKKEDNAEGAEGRRRDHRT
jgi:pseudouridine synthase